MVMSAYITATASFLPGDPVPNDEMEDYLGTVGPATSDLRDLTLENCGIKTRHYAIDKNQQTIISNAAMAANAVRDAAERAGLGPNDVELLTAATTGPDMLAPGHASMVRLPHFQEHQVRRDGSVRPRRIAAGGSRLSALHAL